MDLDAVVHLRSAIARLARQLNATSTDENLTPSQASALGSIAFRGPIGVTALAEVERLNPTMVSRMISVLVAGGLIERHPDPNDLRSATLSITEQGRAMHDRIKRQRTETLRASLERMPEADRDSLLKAVPLLEDLADALSEARTNPSAHDR